MFRGTKLKANIWNFVLKHFAEEKTLSILFGGTVNFPFASILQRKVRLFTVRIVDPDPELVRSDIILPHRIRIGWPKILPVWFGIVQVCQYGV